MEGSPFAGGSYKELPEIFESHMDTLSIYIDRIWEKLFYEVELILTITVLKEKYKSPSIKERIKQLKIIIDFMPHLLKHVNSIYSETQYVLVHDTAKEFLEILKSSLAAFEQCVQGLDRLEKLTAKTQKGR